MDDWQPFCGEEFGRTLAFGRSLLTVGQHERIYGPAVAGDPVVCDSPPHSEYIKHRNSELGYEWW